MVDEAGIAERYRLLAPHLTEQELACWAAAEAIVAGRDGVAAVSRATGLDAAKIRRAQRELRSSQEAGRALPGA